MVAGISTVGFWEHIPDTVVPADYHWVAYNRLAIYAVQLVEYNRSPATFNHGRKEFSELVDRRMPMYLVVLFVWV